MIADVSNTKASPEINPTQQRVSSPIGDSHPQQPQASPLRPLGLQESTSFGSYDAIADDIGVVSVPSSPMSRGQHIGSWSVMSEREMSFEDLRDMIASPQCEAHQSDKSSAVNLAPAVETQLTVERDDIGGSDVCRVEEDTVFTTIIDEGVAGDGNGDREVYVLVDEEV